MHNEFELFIYRRTSLMEMQRHCRLLAFMVVVPNHIKNHCQYPTRRVMLQKSFQHQCRKELLYSIIKMCGMVLDQTFQLHDIDEQLWGTIWEGMWTLYKIQVSERINQSTWTWRSSYANVSIQESVAQQTPWGQTSYIYGRYKRFQSVELDESFFPVIYASPGAGQERTMWLDDYIRSS